MKRLLTLMGVILVLVVLRPSAAAWQPAQAVAPADGTNGQTAADVGTLKDYVSGDNARTGAIEVAQLGVLVYDARAKLESGQEVAGVAVVDVVPAGAAERAGIPSRASSSATTAVIIGATVAAAVFFPPAVIGVALLARMQAMKPYDLIIGVDGNRVKNTLELTQAVADFKTGDIAYLAMVQKGHRVQVPVVVP